MRVVAGVARGRRLAAPAGDRTRPTSDRVREAVFNALDSLGELRGATVLDLFAGSGALGIEALSRGAASVTFVDADRDAVRAISSNLEATGLAAAEAATGAGAGRSRVVRGDALAHVRGLAGPVELVLADPPYAFDDWAGLQQELRDRCPGALLVAESDRPVAPVEGGESLRERRYGGTVVTFIRLPATPGGVTAHDGGTPSRTTPPIPEDLA